MTNASSAAFSHFPAATPADPALAGLECPRCTATLLHSSTNGYSSCWCGRCGSRIALSASVNATPGSGLVVTVVGLRDDPALREATA